ncbi:Metallo-beta-lactamase superfamily protein [Mycena kentingensis (nom. inval.)]|nr:Metallo-beta-lactamase superfamily protein [Mycena kentingensis (nom. inval.)]
MLLLLLTLTLPFFQAMATLGIPVSDATVSVSRFNVATLTAISPPFVFPLYSFLVEHGSGRRLVFDLGVRKDPLNLSPSAAAKFVRGNVIPNKLEKDMLDMLEDAGIPGESIESIVWSHTHYDHIGDASRFPNTTSLVFGAETNLSAYPTFPNATLQESDLAGKTHTKIDFSTAELKFNDMRAIDYFGDGSFYLVDTPGHMPGHLTGLARVTAGAEPTFLLLAGDTYHHPGEARPRPAFQDTFPAPAPIIASARAHVNTSVYFSPGSHDGAFDLPSRATPMLAITSNSSMDPVTSTVTGEKIARWDASADVLVLMAHDLSVVEDLEGGGLPYHPQLLNGWKAAGWKKDTVWEFMDFENPAWAFG